MSDEAERLFERLLVLRCQTGDEDAYRELVGRFGPRLRYFLRKLVGQIDRADDLAQEVWIDVLRQLPRLKDAGAFTTWMYRIAHNEAYSMLRRKKPEDDLETAQFDMPSMGSHMLPVETALAVDAALQRLSDEQREAVVLKIYQGFKFEEMSEILGCPMSTVKSRLYTALDLLKDTLAPAAIPRSKS